jgi:hypothetical protein
MKQATHEIFLEQHQVSHILDHYLGLISMFLSCLFHINITFVDW